MHGDACANRRGSGLGRRVYRDKSKAVEMRAQTFAIGKSHPSAERAAWKTAGQSRAERGLSGATLAPRIKH